MQPRSSWQGPRPCRRPGTIRHHPMFAEAPAIRRGLSRASCTLRTCICTGACLTYVHAAVHACICTMPQTPACTYTYTQNYIPTSMYSWKDRYTQMQRKRARRDQALDGPLLLRDSHCRKGPTWLCRITSIHTLIHPYMHRNIHTTRKSVMKPYSHTTT